MQASDRWHVDDHSVDQFDPRIWRERAPSRHAVVLVDSNAMPARPVFHCDAHASSPEEFSVRDGGYGYDDSRMTSSASASVSWRDTKLKSHS
jgi:hypothetical protein